MVSIVESRERRVMCIVQFLFATKIESRNSKNKIKKM